MHSNLTTFPPPVDMVWLTFLLWCFMNRLGHMISVDQLVSQIKKGRYGGQGHHIVGGGYRAVRPVTGNIYMLVRIYICIYTHTTIPSKLSISYYNTRFSGNWPITVFFVADIPWKTNTPHGSRRLVFACILKASASPSRSCTALKMFWASTVTAAPGRIGTRHEKNSRTGWNLIAGWVGDRWLQELVHNFWDFAFDSKISRNSHLVSTHHERSKQNRVAAAQRPSRMLFMHVHACVLRCQHSGSL